MNELVSVWQNQTGYVILLVIVIILAGVSEGYRLINAMRHAMDDSGL